MNQIPVGMYQPGNSYIYRLKAYVKLLAFFALTVAIILADTLLEYALLLLTISALIYIAKISFRTAFGTISRLKWFFLLIFVMNLCFYAPEEPWAALWILRPSYGGMLQGIHVVLRTMLVLVISNILTVTTTPLALTEGIAVLIKPLKLFKIPTEQIALILSVAMQFIPTLFEEAEMIKKAQTARGARFDSKNWIDKAKAVLPLVIPIFLAAFKRADELSLAMEARGYRTDMYVRK